MEAAIVQGRVGRQGGSRMGKGASVHSFVVVAWAPTYKGDSQKPPCLPMPP